MPLSEHVVPGLEVKMKRIRCLTALVVMLMLFGSKQGYAQSGDRELQRFREIYKELVETNTTLSAGDCTLAAKRMSARLKTAGYPDADLRVFVPDGHPKEGGLLAVLHGSDPKAKAILLLGHLDVVEAKREDWTRDPFSMIEENGYFYGRGTFDDKAHVRCGSTIWFVSGKRGLSRSAPSNWR